ncbi:heme ABC transporter permease CcmC [Aliiroseovarius subalbicans]|uniref:heme ABC transporter permease CcmC n=1 Tax=Aliiroseovarius subalbicans TaxID=2925840 RepID=UPI001F55EEE6|nr:heme ABC transporter permease CcmC [Aliiroseovarius subalbicans]MCI2398871.1 heme ABC transporter permease CcmC [Aliiroseovarius subalbicans]
MTETHRTKQAEDRWNWLWEWANPVKFMSLSGKILPWVMGLCALTLLPGLIWGFFFTPEAVNFGSSVKIIYVHVPTAMLAINIWVMMLVASLIWLVRRHHVSALAAKAAALIGLTMTVAALFTGAIWGEPMWGTYWAWDPRLTSFLILFLFYLGYMALWGAIDDPDTAADLTSVLCLVGSVFALLSRYAVNFWNQGLHQGASLSLDKQENVSDVYWQPLVLAIVGFSLLFVTLLLLRTRTEVRRRRTHALETRERMADA